MGRIWFFDDRDVVAWQHVTRHVHRPRKHPDGPVMRPETTLEKRSNRGWAWPSVLFDEQDGLFKAWYEMIVEGKAYGCYAFSEDGLTWQRPDLGLVRFEGSKKNNLFYLGYLLCYRTAKPNMDVELAYSADAQAWTRVAPNVRYIRNGPHGSWDCGLIHCAPAPVCAGDKMYVYYLGTNSNHAGGTVDGRPLRTSLCLAVATPGRMVSVRAKRSGTVLVGPVKVTGGRLLLDADTRKGELAVALRKPDTFDELPGFGAKEADKVSNNASDHPASWKGNSNLSRLRGRSVLIQAHLEQGDLFSLRFA